MDSVARIPLDFSPLHNSSILREGVRKNTEKLSRIRGTFLGIEENASYMRRRGLK